MRQHLCTIALRLLACTFSCINHSSGYEFTQFKCVTVGMQTGAASGSPASAQDAPSKSLSCMYVCMPKASVHDVHKPVHTHTHASHCLLACLHACTKHIVQVWRVCPKYYSSERKKERREITSLTVSPCGELCRETQFC